MGLSSTQYLLLEGWKLLGWASAPSPGSGKHAIVYEKTTAADMNTNSRTDHLEPGVYWCHGNADEMLVTNALPKELEEEIGPWL